MNTAPAPNEDPPLLELRDIHKAFPGVKALQGVSFEVRAGEIHMLLGENGAGKSTLMKVLCGASVADAGQVLHRGAPVVMRTPADARRLGIAVIFQEFSLVPHLDVAHNILLGREPRGRVPGLVDTAALYGRAGEAMSAVGLVIDPRTPLHRLGVAQQQMVEIAKAVSQRARILVMDEPTAALSDRETNTLFDLMRRLSADGVAIIYISHRMAEVFAMGDRITVLRDGRKVAGCLPAEVSPDDLVRLMVGRDVDVAYTRRQAAAPGEQVLEVRDLASSNGCHGIDLQVRRGEIVGLCGLVGSGRTEVLRAIFGADRLSAGSVRTFGQPIVPDPVTSRAAGIGLLPESRKSQGLALSRTVAANLVMAAYRRIFPGGILNPRRLLGTARELIERLRIATPSPHQTAGALSGGNQQKIVIGKWLAAGTRLFLFDEPTRGIDVGAKAEIFQLMYELVDAGAAVLMVSSEQQEIVSVCDRAYVMRDGTVVGELAGDRLTEYEIVRLGIQHE